ncbi:ribonuclease P protein component [Cryptococcus amylolentus CBS 6273]|uniref:Ribonuclease P protein component n=1 Tax=Cryptococcus amylolentus CBS 6273 TaxID=1296118 RepID=A0A1E3KEP8_9TREE|nr:ribonuclease P protein component [Cryptococcus amylolentus CBS 6273]
MGRRLESTETETAGRLGRMLVLLGNRLPERKAFIGIDLGTALPRIFTSRPTMQYITPLFAIRLFPASALPLRPAPPFPLHAIARKRQEMKAEAACVYAVVIASKAKVSKLAVERNKVRRKIMEAMRTVVNAPGMVGKNLVSPEHAYIISANPEVYDAPMEMLVNDVERSLVTIRKKMEKAGDVKSGAELWLPEPRYLSKEGRRW